MFDNKSAKRQLVAALKARRTVLLAGAGSSRSVGYPSWPMLVEQLRTTFANHLGWPINTPAMTFASTIVAEICKNKKQDAYHNFLEKMFEPRRDRSRQHDDFHVAMVRLPFCGLVTTNYERVIESAVGEAFGDGQIPYLCEGIDLCDERVYRVFEFFRSLTVGDPRWVLHLHGYYRNPQRLILTEENYLSRYGELPAYDNDGSLLNVNLNSLHRKVLWALCISHPLVFIGFSLDDGFFVHILQILRQDLQLGDDFTHFAIMHYTTQEERERIAEKLSLLNTLPVFYYAPPLTTPGQETDHSGLKRLIYELAEEVGVSVVPDAIASMNKRMLEL